MIFSLNWPGRPLFGNVWLNQIEKAQNRFYRDLPIRCIKSPTVFVKRNPSIKGTSLPDCWYGLYTQNARLSYTGQHIHCRDVISALHVLLAQQVGYFRILSIMSHCFLSTTSVAVTEAQCQRQVAFLFIFQGCQMKKNLSFLVEYEFSVMQDQRI